MAVSVAAARHGDKPGRMDASDGGCNGLSVTKPCLQTPGRSVDILYVDQAAGARPRR